MDETFEYKHNEGVQLKRNNKTFFSLVPLDFLKDTFTNRITVMKIDVEGLEYHVIKGAKEVILEHKPVIFVEIFEQNYQKVCDLLSEYGYDEGQYLVNEDYVFKLKM
jgi:hypothetical protein